MGTVKDIKAVYQQGYAKEVELMANPRLAKVLSIAHESRPDKCRNFLDIGCGDGEFTVRLSKEFGAENLFGVDIAPRAVELAGLRGINAVCCDIDIADIPYEDGCFDVIYCGHLIELVLNADHLLAEAKRLLAPQGIMIVTQPNLGAWASRLALMVGRMPFYSRVSTEYDFGKLFSSPKAGQSTGFIRLFTTSAFREFLNLCGFRVKAISGVGENALPGLLKPMDLFLTQFPSLAFHNVWVVTHAVGDTQ